MKTIVINIGYENIDDYKIIYNDDRIYSSIVRFSYKRLIEKLSLSTIYKKSCEIYKDFPTHLIASANREAKSIFTKVSKIKDFDLKKIKFGLIDKRKKLLISRDEFKQSRLRGIFSEGEVGLYKGNRYFSIDVNNNKIIYKRSKKEHIVLNIKEKLSNKRKQVLSSIQIAMLNRLCPISFRLKNNKIYISYNEQIIEKQKKFNNLKNNRVLGIDLNPNFIGLSILKFNKKDNFDILRKEVFDILELQNTGTKNKVKFELQQIANQIIVLCQHYKVSKISIENLSFKNKGRGKYKAQKKFNQLCNNKWRRTQFISHLKTLCLTYGIELIEVNCAYSSIVGNLNYGNKTTPDMIAASIEIARRAYKKFNKGWFYPEYNIQKIQKQIQNLQKKEIFCKSKSWKELFKEIKEFGNKWFRFQLNENDAVFRKSYYKAKYKVNIFK